MSIPLSVPSLFQMGYYWEAKIFLVSVRLDIYSALAHGPQTPSQISRRIGADPAMLARLLDALVTLGLLTKSGVEYANTPIVSEFLVKESPFYMGELMWLQDEEWAHWGKLEETLRSGRPPVSGHLFANRPEVAEKTLKVLHRMAQRTAPDLARKVDLSACRTLLDVGGGSGVFSLEFCGQNPALQVTLFDLPQTLQITRRNIEAAGMSDRIHLMPGDFNRDTLPGPFDVVFLSDILHYQTFDENAALVRKLFQSVRPGGKIVMKDMFIDDDPEHPGWNAIFLINHPTYTEKGRCFRTSEARSWLKEAGFDSIVEVERHAVLTAVRPDG